MFSPTYISAVVMILVQVLPWLGIPVVSADLTTTVTTILTIGAGLVIIYRRLAKGDINIFGSKKG